MNKLSAQQMEILQDILDYICLRGKGQSNLGMWKSVRSLHLPDGDTFMQRISKHKGNEDLINQEPCLASLNIVDLFGLDKNGNIKGGV